MRDKIKKLIIVLLPLVAIPAADWWANWFNRHYAIGLAIVQRDRFCLPWRIFWVNKDQRNHDFQKGELLAFSGDIRMPKVFQRHTIIKMVLGVPGDHVSIENGEVRINGTYFDRLWLLDGQPQPNITYTLQEGEYFVVGSSWDSLDSRYFGVVRRDAVVGTAQPVL